MPDADDLSLGRDARERLQGLLAAIRNADTQRELMFYTERFFALQSEVRNYFTLIEREIADKLREFRAVEESEATASMPLHREDDLSERRGRNG